MDGWMDRYFKPRQRSDCFLSVLFRSSSRQARCGYICEKIVEWVVVQWAIKVQGNGIEDAIERVRENLCDVRLMRSPMRDSCHQVGDFVVLSKSYLLQSV